MSSLILSQQHTHSLHANLISTSDASLSCLQFCRAVQILPNKVLCTVGEHSNTYPVDNLRLNYDSTFLISSTYDSVKFWSTSEIPTVWTDSKDDATDCDGVNNEEEEEEGEEKILEGYSVWRMQLNMLACAKLDAEED